MLLGLQGCAFFTESTITNMMLDSREKEIRDLNDAIQGWKETSDDPETKAANLKSKERAATLTKNLLSDDARKYYSVFSTQEFLVIGTKSCFIQCEGSASYFSNERKVQSDYTRSIQELKDIAQRFDIKTQSDNSGPFDPNQAIGMNPDLMNHNITDMIKHNSSSGSTATPISD